MQLNKIEISKSLEKEEIKLRKLQTESVNKSTRGDKQRLELWNTFLPEIRKALKEVINDGKKNSKKRGIYKSFNITYISNLNVHFCFIN